MNQETATKIVARLRALRDMQDRNGLAWLTLEWAAIDISIQYNVRAAELWPEVIRFPVHRNGTYQFTIIMSKLFSAVQRRSARPGDVSVPVRLGTHLAGQL